MTKQQYAKRFISNMIEAINNGRFDEVLDLFDDKFDEYVDENIIISQLSAEEWDAIHNNKKLKDTLYLKAFELLGKHYREIN